LGNVHGVGSNLDIQRRLRSIIERDRQDLYLQGLCTRVLMVAGVYEVLGKNGTYDGQMDVRHNVWCVSQDSSV